MSAIELSSVTKVYGNVRVVDSVSFGVPRGSIFGLLGPNGAGKTTTIRMLNGITMPDSGSITILGEPQKPEHQNIIGYMPEERGLYRKLTVGNQLEYLGALRGLDKTTLKKNIAYWLERFEITSWTKKKTNELSKGMQQKLQFIVTLLHEPEILILDEPVSGLDPINAEIINDIIIEEKKKGRTILLSSHRMEQVEQLCDDIAMIDQGKIVLNGTLREVKKRYGKNFIKVNFSGTLPNNTELSGFPIRIAEKHPNELLFELFDDTQSNNVLRKLTENADISRWERIEPPLKEIFLEAVKQH
jgi:ABC-2 type transport system ATP-binding protein